MAKDAAEIIVESLIKAGVKRVYGIPGDSLNGITEAIRKSKVNRQELSMPPKISLDQMTGFALYMAKAVLSGRGDEIVDLAKTALFR